MDRESLEYSLLAAVCGEIGPFKLNRRYQKARLAMPELEPEDIVAELVEPGAAARGEALARELKAKHIRYITLLGDDYPFMLKAIADPPLLLFYSGELQALHRPAVAMVGSRKTSDYGRQTAYQLAGELARLGFVVVSGLARGIDARAHAAVVEVKGRTVAVLGTGIDAIYPPENRNLARDIVFGGGAVISELPPDTPPRPFHFPIRNRIISGLAHATVVVEAQERSGSLVTARHALDQGRELFAVPGPINQSGSAGTNGLIARGEAQLLESVASLLEHLTPLLGLAVEHKARLEVEIQDPVSQKIYEKLDAFEPLPLDLLVADLGLDIMTVQAGLTDLETRNLIEQRPGQLYLRNPLTL
ncbi:MAG: DNA-processing protein DprA [Acidobacteriota bacterium]|nr:DNA-processing protein DprA [Acidobacteriota bacterium]